MKRPPSPAIMRPCLLLCWVLAVLAPGFAPAQAPGMKQPAESQQATPPATPERPAELRAKLEQAAQEARAKLASLDAPGAAAALPEGISAAELDERRRNLEQLVLTIGRALKNTSVVEEAHKALESSRARETAWTGFQKKPPYSLLMIDDLLNEREAIKSNLTSAEASLGNYERLLATIMDEAKAAEDAENIALAAVQKAGAEPAAGAAAKWRLEAARGRSRLLAARAGLFQSMIDSQQDRITAANTDLTLLERQVKVAKANASFTDEDLANLARISDERKQAIRKELGGLATRLKAAMTARTQAQAAIEAIHQPAGAETPDFELAKYRLEVAEGRVETMQSLNEGLEGLLQLEDVGMKAYHDRRALADAHSLQQRVQALDSLGVPREHLWAWVNVLDDEVARTSAELKKQEARAATIGSGDPRFKLLAEQRANTSEKLAMLQRLSQAVETQRKMVKRWILEYTPEEDQTGLWQQLATFSSRGWGAVKKIWSFEVMTFEDKVEVDGQTLTGRIPITLGMLLRAVMFFVIGYWIAAFIARRIQTGLVGRGHLAEAQARTLRNWGMIVVGMFLILGTLAFMRIPLTVFAFFGGALAIGLGFGTQTLLKNFISGIIVLTERKVRVGDLVDVDGVLGTVTEINTRSSVVRGPDDVETMIPNSVLLDNRVTNWTLSNTRMRRCLRVGVAYGTPPAKVMTVLTEVAGRHGLVCKDPAPFAVFEDFGESALVFALYFWLELPGSSNPMVIASDLRLMIEKRFSETGCGVPFPQRDIHFSAAEPLQVHWIDKPPAAANPSGQAE